MYLPHTPGFKKELKLKKKEIYRILIPESKLFSKCSCIFKTLGRLVKILLKLNTASKFSGCPSLGNMSSSRT
jgi:hypothetical protein